MSFDFDSPRLAAKLECPRSRYAICVLTSPLVISLARSSFLLCDMLNSQLPTLHSLPSTLHPPSSSRRSDLRSLPLVPANRQAMIEEFDLDQDGEISQAEFLAIMTDGE